MTDKEKLEKIKKLADDMYFAAANLGPNVGSGERLRKTMKEYHQFIIHEYNKEEPVSDGQVTESTKIQHVKETCKENDDSLTSEDKMIREELISNFKETIENIRSEEIIPHEAKVLIGKMQKWIAWLEKQGEQKPAGWSEEDKSYLLDFTRWFEQKAKAYNINLPMRGYDICAFCKEIIERLRICENLVWENINETQRTNAIIMLKEGARRVYTQDSIDKCVDWLKSLRPQSQWRPSDEQIKAVKEAACYSSVFSEKTIDNLITFSKQLEKLREEKL